MYLNGDDSEEAKAKRQETSESLKEAEKDLEASEYDRWLQDQTSLLDSLYEEFDRVLNERLDNIDGLLRDMIAYANTNTSTVSDTITKATTDVGYSISDTLRNIWNTTDSGIGAVLSEYTKGFGSNFTTVNKYIKGIYEMIHLNTKSKYQLEKPKPTPTKKPTTPASPSSSNNNNKPAQKKEVKVGGMFRADGKPIYWDSYGKVGPYGSQQYFGSDPVYYAERENNGYILGRWYKSPAGQAAGWFKKSDLTAMATGGYTGEFEGMAMLHKKERVLSAKQTKAFEQLVYDYLPNLTDQFIKNSSVGSITKTLSSGDTVNNLSLTINAPNVTDTESLLKELGSKKVQDYIASMVLDPLNGKSGLRKNLYKGK